MAPWCSLLLSFLWFSTGDAQAGIDDPEREEVAQYASDFSQGRIWSVDDDLSLELNGVVMSDTSDEHLYHELLVHPAIWAADSPRDVLIIGGAEGATAREVLKHNSVQNVSMVDIDEKLVNMCRTHLRPMHQGSFDSPKMKVHFEDGASFVNCLPAGALDVVIVDGIDATDDDFSDWWDALLGPDLTGKFNRMWQKLYRSAHGLLSTCLPLSPLPVTYGEPLFSPDFYRSIHRVLRKDGVMVQYMSDVDREAEVLNAGFDQLTGYGVDISSYLGDGARFMLAKKGAAQMSNKERISQALSQSNLALKYLNRNTMEDALRHTARRLKGYYGGGGMVVYENDGGGGGGSMAGVGMFVLACICMFFCFFVLVSILSACGQAVELE